jgi:hypothetical protein
LSAPELPSNPDILRAIVAWYEAAGFMHHAFDAAIAPLERVAPDSPTSRSLDAARRVMRAYQRARGDGIAAGLSMWSAIEQRHSAFLAAMDAGAVDTVQAHLGRMFATDLTWGMARLGPDDPGAERVTELRCTDVLRSLAESCGAERLISTEQSGGASLRTALKIDLDAVLAATEQATGLDLRCAKVGATRGCRIGGKLVNVDSVLHSYTVARLRRHGATAASTIVEIGGGYGCLGELFARAGLGRYTIYDLPWVNALQGYYLIMACPDVKVRLYGEDEGDLAVMPFWRIHDLGDRSVDYVININSMPEMNAEVVRDYIAVIARIVRRAFLSINQEAMAPAIGGPQQWVHGVVERQGGLVCTSRQRWWMEQGYAEELYEPPAR